MRLILVRHAETLENIKGIVSGHHPGILTEKGKGQAKKLASRLKNEKIDVIFSSDLQRAKDTTEEIARFHKVPIYYTSELRERTLGLFEGRPREEFYKAQDESGLSFAEFTPEGGEGFTKLKGRARRFLSRLFEKYKDETILISSHGGWIKMLLGVLFDKSIEEALEVEQDNACINIVEVGEGFECKAHMINDIGHL